ncbi:MAG: efflux RND transporter periplasmic adaptor subunit [Planctomycetes bacterium]|nr:efflux RND transporter periplasmic adaptor subunit [Planctomycetota bacterium]
MHRSIAVRALLLCSLFVAACQPSDSAAASSNASGDSGLKPRERSRVLVEPVAEREMLKTLDTTTKVESEFQHEIVPRASGLVTEVLAEEGDRVEAGQVLARLDDREAKIAVGEAEVALKEARDNVPKLAIAIKEAESRAESARRSAEQAQRDFERNETISVAGTDRPGLLSAKELEQSRLQRDQAVSDYDTAKLALERARVEYESAKNAVARAELQLQQAQLMFSYMEILAPARGVIALRSLKVGDSVAATTSFSARAGVAGFTLVDIEALRVVFYRPQRELALFRPRETTTREAVNGDTSHAGGLELTATTEAMPNAKFRGLIERVSPTIDAQSGAFRVTAAMQVTAENDPSAMLLPGMLVRLEIVTERHPNAMVVPKRAVLREGEVGHVVVVRDGRAHRVAVEEGLSDEEYVEVRAQGDATLKVGELVVVVGNRDLEEGAEVEIDASSASAKK